MRIFSRRKPQCLYRTDLEISTSVAGEDYLACSFPQEAATTNVLYLAGLCHPGYPPVRRPQAPPRAAIEGVRRRLPALEWGLPALEWQLLCRGCRYPALERPSRSAASPPCHGAAVMLRALWPPAQGEACVRMSAFCGRLRPSRGNVGAIGCRLV